MSPRPEPPAGDAKLHCLPGPAPLDARTFAVGVLSVTACVLLVGILLLSATPRAALATGQMDRAGDYLMLTQQISNSEEAVVVIDAASQRMSLYFLDPNTRKLVAIQQGLPLDTLPTGRRDGGRGRP